MMFSPDFLPEVDLVPVETAAGLQGLLLVSFSIFEQLPWPVVQGSNSQCRFQRVREGPG